MRILSNRRPTNRCGTIYVAVLGVTLIVGVMASVGLSLTRLERRVNQADGNQQQARILAQTAVEYATNWCVKNSNWRTLATNDAETTQITFGNGTISWKYSDADGSFTDDLSDNVEVYGYGRVGDSVAVESVTLEPRGTALSCLESVIHAGANLSCGTSASINGCGFLSANNNIVANSSDYHLNCEAANTITGSTYHGIQTPGVPSRDMPQSSVFNYYVNNGTVIDYTSLDSVTGGRRIQAKLLSPNSNPYGATNPEGIYVIDCQGGDLIIRWSRIVGTLVLLNAGSGSEVSAEVHWEPAVENYPVMLVQGDMAFDLTGLFGNQYLLEGTLFVNFNPPGTPYQGVTDSNTSTNYPSTINGLIYLTGVGRITDDCNMRGCIVSGSFEVNNNQDLSIHYQDIYLNYPPPGFAKGDPMQIIRRSWQRQPYTY